MSFDDIKVLSHRLLSGEQSHLLIISLHLIFLFFLYFILSFFGFIEAHPANYNLVQWDAKWFSNIVDYGYSLFPDEPSNIAFFPLFPVVWRITQFSPVLISLLNLLFMLLGFILLKKTYNFNNKELLLMLSIPSIFFCYTPYSEGLFFLSGSILLYGLKKDFNIALLGMFMLGLSRSVFLISIPVILYSILYNVGPNQNNKKLFIQSSLLILVSLMSLLFSQFIQYIESGTYFTFFETQKEWGRILSLPSFYFSTTDNARLIWLDGLALFCGIAAIITSCALMIRKFKNILTSIAPSVLFSICFVAVTAITHILFSPKDNFGGTSLLSLNRYIFSSPFFMGFLFVIFKNWSVNRLTIFKFVVVSLLVWPLFDPQVIQISLEQMSLPANNTALYFGAVILYCFSFFLVSRKAYQNVLWSGLYAFNIIVQVFLFNQYLNSIWIG